MEKEWKNWKKEQKNETFREEFLRKIQYNPLLTKEEYDSFLKLLKDISDNCGGEEVVDQLIWHEYENYLPFWSFTPLYRERIVQLRTYLQRFGKND